MTAEYMHGTPAGGTALPCRVRIADVTYPAVVVVVPPTYFRVFILERGRWTPTASSDLELFWIGEGRWK